MVLMTIKLWQENKTFLASLEDTDEIIAGHGDDPYKALHDLINELEYHEYFRED